jgi:hypothetical protein
MTPTTIHFGLTFIWNVILNRVVEMIWNGLNFNILGYSEIAGNFSKFWYIKPDNNINV